MYMCMNCINYHALGEQLGSEPTLPYLSPELDGQKLLVGANFASAGIGILNDTGIQFVRLNFFFFFSVNHYHIANQTPAILIYFLFCLDHSLNN